jgi:hypothetical protein
MAAAEATCAGLTPKRVLYMAAAAKATCAGLTRGAHPGRRLWLQGPLAIDPACIQRLSANLAFLVVSDPSGATVELIAKVRDGFLCPMDIDALCTTCAALDGAEVFPEVDTDTGDRLFFHLVSTKCLPGGQELPDAAHRAGYAQAQEQHRQSAARARTAGTSTAKKWGGTSNDNRASVFVKWLLETYSLPWLTSGVGVLDVAGGSGQVAWNLTCLRRCPSVIVDPRPALTNSKQRAYLRCQTASLLSQCIASERRRRQGTAAANAEPPQAICGRCCSASGRPLPPSHRNCFRACIRTRGHRAPRACGQHPSPAPIQPRGGASPPRGGIIISAFDRAAGQPSS